MGSRSRRGQAHEQGERSGSRLIAWFDSYDAVRRVELDLERHGVDSLRITTQRPVEVKTRDVDDETAKWAAGRATIGLAVGALAGAVVGLVVGLFFVGSSGDASLFALAGAIFGAAAGFFYGFAVNLPTDPEVLDTLGVTDDAGSTDDAHWILVEGPTEEIQDASSVVGHHDPRKLHTE